MPIDQKENVIRARIEDPSLFDESSFRTKDLGDGIQMVMGKKKDDQSGSMVGQSILFDKSMWDVEKVKSWLNEHNYEVMQKEKEMPDMPMEADKQMPQMPNMQQPPKQQPQEDKPGVVQDKKPPVNEEDKNKMPMLHSIEGVEVFSAGTWNGDEYSEKDLDEMVKAFTEMSETFKPPLKLGHSENQALLQQDGYPAAGWIGKLYRKGKKLLADFIDVPNKVYQLIENKSYRNVSSEIFWDIDCGEGKKYNRMLAAVSLLGADVPAVMNLRDILSNYSNYTLKYNTIASKKNYITIENELSLNIKTRKEKEVDISFKNLENEVRKYKAEVEEKELKVKEYEAKILDFEAKEKQNKLNSEVNELLNEKLITPSMKPYVLELLNDEKKVYELKVNDKDSKLTKFELLKETLKLFSQSLKLNTENKTIDGNPINQSKDQEEEIAKYMEEHKASYSQAYRAINKGKLTITK